MNFKEENIDTETVLKVKNVLIDVLKISDETCDCEEQNIDERIKDQLSIEMIKKVELALS